MLYKYSHLSITDLHTLLKKSDKRAFDVLFQRYWKRLYTYSYRIYPREKICEDIVQELFIDLWERREDVQIENLEGYLFRAVKYKIATHLRNLKFDRVHIEVLDEIRVEAKIEQQLHYREFENYIQEEVAKLPRCCRNVFVLSRFEHYSNTEIAENLNISIRTVEKHISNAIRHLRHTVKPDGFLFIIILMFL